MAVDCLVLNGGCPLDKVPGAAVAGENDQRLFAQLQPVEFSNEFGDELIHISDIFGIELIGVGPGFAVGRVQDRAVKVGH